MTYIPQPIEREGNQDKIMVSDNNARQLLTDVLKELKKMNIQMEILSDNRITDQEL